MLAKYDLPTIIFDCTPTKKVWKNLVKTQVHNFWQKHLEEIASTMSTLTYFNSTPSFLEAHHAFGIISNLSMVRRANTNWYIHSAIHPYSSLQTDPLSTVSVVHEGGGNHEHFRLLCPKLQEKHEERVIHLHTIMSRILYIYKDIDLIYKDNHLLLHLILDLKF